MIINADARGLEWVVAAYLSQDETAIYEITNEFDQHSDNQKRFGLPERVIAKIFVFRTLYGGSPYAFSVDPAFSYIGDEKFWQKVLDEFYNKYKGIAVWHKKLLRDATRNGKIVIPSGREYHFRPNPEGKWPRTKILNYPVQGFGADLMMIARISFANRLKAAGLKCLLINSVHDSIMADCPLDEVDQVCKILDQVFRDIPMNFERLYGVKFNVPMYGEISYGPNWKDQTIWEAA